MIKGCSRRVIVVKGHGSDLFDEAYFIVSPKESERKHGDLLLEANRIICSKTVSEHEAGKRGRGLIMLAAGFACGVCAALPVMYIIL